jgi:hypothetical protein
MQTPAAKPPGFCFLRLPLFIIDADFRFGQFLRRRCRGLRTNHQARCGVPMQLVAAPGVSCPVTAAKNRRSIRVITRLENLGPWNDLRPHRLRLGERQVASSAADHHLQRGK